MFDHVEDQGLPWRLVKTGLTLGSLHVLTPDHISALSALSVGSSWRAFQLGVRWGVGHSSGLLLVTAFFVYLKGDLDLRRFGRFCDALVGVFMMVIGSYGAFGAIKHAREKKKLKDDSPKSGVVALGGGEEEMFLTKVINNLCDVENKVDSTAGKRIGKAPKLLSRDDTGGPSASSGGWLSHPSNSTTNSNSSMDAIDIDDLDHDARLLANDCNWCPFIDMRDPLTQRIVSFAIGLLHGFAGPGGVLAVFPTVQMTSWKSASLYLGSFIISSTFSMGVFASFFGETTRRLGAGAESVELGLRIFSSVMSVVVGVVWLTLSILGKLENFFH